MDTSIQNQKKLSRLYRMSDEELEAELEQLDEEELEDFLEIIEERKKALKQRERRAVEKYPELIQDWQEMQSEEVSEDLESELEETIEEKKGSKEDRLSKLRQDLESVPAPASSAQKKDQLQVGESEEHTALPKEEKWYTKVSETVPTEPNKSPVWEIRQKTKEQIESENLRREVERRRNEMEEAKLGNQEENASSFASLRKDSRPQETPSYRPQKEISVAPPEESSKSLVEKLRSEKRETSESEVENALKDL